MSYHINDLVGLWYLKQCKLNMQQVFDIYYQCHNQSHLPIHTIHAPHEVYPGTFRGLIGI